MSFIQTLSDGVTSVENLIVNAAKDIIGTEAPPNSSQAVDLAAAFPSGSATDNTLPSTTPPVGAGITINPLFLMAGGAVFLFILFKWSKRHG